MNRTRYRVLHHPGFRVLLAVLSIFSAFTGAADAAIITNLTTRTLIFIDDFDLRVFAPSAGSWSVIGPSVSVTNASAVPPGNFYANLFRNTTTVVNQGTLTAMLSIAQTVPGEVVRLRMTVFIPNDGVNARGQFALSNGDFPTARAWVQPDGNGNVIAVGLGLVLTATGLHYIPDTWQRWELTYAIGSSTFSVEVDGRSASGFPSPTTGAVSHANLLNGNGSPGSVYVDASPPVGGAVTGVRPTRVTCKNITTGESVVILDRARSWDCEEAGLVVRPGDILQETISRGIAD